MEPLGRGSVWPPEPELLASVLLGDRAALAELFSRRMNACAKPYLHDECFTHGPFSDLLASPGGVTPETAFVLMAGAVDLVIAERQRARIECALSLLSGLARATKTTEVPQRLLERWDDIAELARGASPLALSYWADVTGWYRRATPLT